MNQLPKIPSDEEDFDEFLKEIDDLGILQKYNFLKETIFWKNKTRILKLLAFIQKKISSPRNQYEGEVLFCLLYDIIESIR